MADRLLGSLKKLAQDKERLRAREHKVLGEEQRRVRQLDRLLARLGYHVVSDDGRRTAGSVRSPKRARPKILRCPKCDRRFSHPLPMARHLSATHGTRRRARKEP